MFIQRPVYMEKGQQKQSGKEKPVKRKDDMHWTRTEPLSYTKIRMFTLIWTGDDMHCSVPVQWSALQNYNVSNTHW